MRRRRAHARRYDLTRLGLTLALALCVGPRRAGAVPAGDVSATAAPEAADATDDTAATEIAAVEPPRRPRLTLAAGMGVTLDGSGFADGTHAIPAFFAVGGFGDGLLGLDLGSFASGAAGRFHGQGEDPVDRLALDAFAAIRPLARVARGDNRYHLRVLRTFAEELGLGLERDGRMTVAGSRFELHTGVRIELPLTPAGQPSELRLRLAVRRAVGLYTPKLYDTTTSDVTRVGNTTEAYAALAVVF
jgi:hypothetical protein